MKKVMFLVVCLMIVSTVAFALESGPSNKVGYIKITCAAGATPTVYGYTPFGLPFKFWDVPTGNVPTYGTETFKPSSIVGLQTNCGNSGNADKIILQGGNSAYRSCTSGWQGLLETGAGMVPGKAYYYANRTGAVRSLVLAGEADTTAVGIPAVTITGPVSGASYINYSWRDPRYVARDKLNLWTNGFTGGNVNSSDRVVEQGGNYFTCNTANPPVWSGLLLGVTPGRAYYIVNKHLNHTWTYQYVASGANLIAPPAGNDHTAVPTELRNLTPTAKTKTVRTVHATN